MFYYHIRQSTKPDKDLDLKEHINHIYHQHKGRYGYRRITSELNNQLAQKGMVINHKRVQRLMAKLGLKALVRRQRKFNTYKGTMGKDTIQDNILKSGQQTSPSLKYKTRQMMAVSFKENSTYRPSSTCLMVRLSVIR